MKHTRPVDWINGKKALDLSYDIRNDSMGWALWLKMVDNFKRAACFQYSLKLPEILSKCLHYRHLLNRNGRFRPAFFVDTLDSNLRVSMYFLPESIGIRSQRAISDSGVSKICCDKLQFSDMPLFPASFYHAWHALVKPCISDFFHLVSVYIFMYRFL